MIWKIKNCLVHEGNITQQFKKPLEASAVLETFFADLCSIEIAFEVDVAPALRNI